MGLSNLKKYGLLLYLWPFGVSLVVGIRIVFMNFAKSFMFMVFFCVGQFWHAVKANPMDDLPWILDEPQILSHKVNAGIAHILAESAHNRNIHIRVIILDMQGDNLKEKVNQKVMEFRNKIPNAAQRITTFYIINLATNKSSILLGEELVKTDPLMQSLIRIQHHIILPLLAQGQIDNALAQGVVALTTVLEAEHESNLETLVQKISVWLSDHYLLLPLQLFCFISILFGCWKGYRYCYPLTDGYTKQIIQ